MTNKMKLLHRTYVDQVLRCSIHEEMLIQQNAVEYIIEMMDIYNSFLKIVCADGITASDISLADILRQFVTSFVIV